VLVIEDPRFAVLVIVFMAIGAGEAFSRLACHAVESKVVSVGRKAFNSGLVAILLSNFSGAVSMMRAGSISIAVRMIGAGVDTETNSEAVEMIGDGVMDTMRAGSISTAVRRIGAGVDTETYSEAVERIGDGVTDIIRAGSISTAVRMSGAGVEPVTM